MADYRTYTDPELARLLKQGDEKAYTEIYQRYVISLTNFAESKLYSLDDARDLIHDLFTNLWSGRFTAAIHDNLKAYLFATARHLIIDKIRKNVVRETYASRLRSLSPAFHSFEEELNARYLENRLSAVLAELPQKTQLIYSKSRIENKSIHEIADELGLSDQTIKNQVSIALKHLRKYLSILFFSIF